MRPNREELERLVELLRNARTAQLSPAPRVPAIPALRIHRRNEPRLRRVTPRAERDRCGALCRPNRETGERRTCRAAAVWDPKRNAPVNGRCRMHGGLSTGPRTTEGLERMRAAVKARRARERAAAAPPTPPREAA